MTRLYVATAARLRELRSDANDTGAVAAEYGVLLAGIIAVVALGATALGVRIGAIYDSILP
ncbi:MAG: Flp family type IVb pilin [Acidimicrobiales bacterium]